MLVLSRAKGTFGKYMPLVRSWEEFALKYRYPSSCPAASSLFIVYLQSLKAAATVKGTKGSAVSDTVYAVDFPTSSEAWTDQVWRLLCSS